MRFGYFKHQPPGRLSKVILAELKYPNCSRCVFNETHTELSHIFR